MIKINPANKGQYPQKFKTIKIYGLFIRLKQSELE